MKRTIFRISRIMLVGMTTSVVVVLPPQNGSTEASCNDPLIISTTDTGMTSCESAGYGFDLSTREVASLIYMAIIVVALVSWKGSHKHLVAIVRAFFARKLVYVWTAMSLYVFASVYLLAWLNLWAWPNLKSTLLWWLTVGFASMFEAQRLKERPDRFRKLVLESFTMTAVLLFVVELVSFPLWVELIMLPAVVFLTLLVAVAEFEARHVRVLKFLKIVEVLAGLLILAVSVALVVRQVDEFWTLSTAREFVLPFLLWLLFVPYIYMIAVIMAYEEYFVVVRFRPNAVPIVKYAQWRALLAFGPDIRAVKRFTQHLRVWDVTDEAGVRAAISEIKKLRKRKRNPPRVDPADGWSPYAAQVFLKEHGITTGDYHRVPWGWQATSVPVKLSDKALASSVSYSISGKEHAATELHLSLDGWTGDHEHDPEVAFEDRALTLLTHVFDEPRAERILALAISQTPTAAEADGVSVQFEHEEWGEGTARSFCRSLLVRHARHVEVG